MSKERDIEKRLALDTLREIVGAVVLNVSIADMRTTHYSRWVYETNKPTKGMVVQSVPYEQTLERLKERGIIAQARDKENIFISYKDNPKLLQHAKAAYFGRQMAGLIHGVSLLSNNRPPELTIPAELFADALTDGLREAGITPAVQRLILERAQAATKNKERS